MATGWLGWPPDVAWRTPIPELFMAMDGRIEWAKMTNPFGRPQEEKPKPTTVAEKIRAALLGRRAK
ncbi:hypothetical protein MCB86_16880 [Pseudomonas sp. KSR10]|nr:hypothetical protein [Pseudomonas sp. KSR10]